MKYDPSKYCHNLKKIAEDVTHSTPVSSLTWELEGGDDPMSKKRRGEFCAIQTPAQQRIKAQKDKATAASPAVRAGALTVPGSPHPKQQEVAQEAPCELITAPLPRVPASHSQKPNSMFVQTSGVGTARRRNHMSDDDTDSEEEIRLLIAREESLGKTMLSSVGDSANESFEVVGGDFRSGVHKLHSVTALGVGNVSDQDGEGNALGNDCNYDSGDTDEIIAAKKKTSKVKNSAEFSQMEKYAHKKTPLKNRKNCELSDPCVKGEKRKTKPDGAISPRVTARCSSREDGSSASESAESAGDEEYEAMMKNCLHVQLTLADLEQLAGGDLQALEEDPESGSQETTAKCDRTLGGLHRARPCICPEDIVAALLEGEENTCGKQKLKGNNLQPKFQAFKGVGSLYGKESIKKPLKESVPSDNINKDQNSFKFDPSSMSMEKGSPPANGSSGKLTPLQHAKKANDPNQTQPQKRCSPFQSQDHEIVSPSSSEEGGRNPVSSLLPLKDKKISLGTITPKVGFDEDCRHRTGETGDGSRQSSHPAPGKAPEGSSRRDAQGSSTNFPLPVNSWSDVHTKEKHADNQKRLAALDARQKAKEVRKKLVHNALADLDGHPEDKPTHIIFGSDSETEEQSHLGEEPVQEAVSRASGRLFDSSEDEESGFEDDSHRFRIKPQFEGRAGQKLLDLQSHFGTDNRFRMDSRFLESDSEEEQEEENDEKTAEEEELAAEKLKALNVVQSVLHTTVSSSAHKGSAAAKKFRDVVHYDPTRNDHAAYERKSDDKPKESKAKRRKQREEAEKLPEVSKEMYYSVAADLKEIFQTTKVTSETADDTPSTENRDGEKVDVHLPTSPTTGAKQHGGFTFSFFDSDAKDVKEDAYRAEPVKTRKVVWQGTPRFQDSSSEEEDIAEEETEGSQPSPREVSLPEKETTRFFFFSKNDERLHVGSDLFWRGVGSDISRNSWEARTNNLRMDCRKKHKDAKRRVKPK